MKFTDILQNVFTQNLKKQNICEVYFNIVFNKTNLYFIICRLGAILLNYICNYISFLVLYFLTIYIYILLILQKFIHTAPNFSLFISKSEPLAFLLESNLKNIIMFLSIFRVYIYISRCSLYFYKIIRNDILFHFHHKHHIFYQLDFQHRP